MNSQEKLKYEKAQLEIYRTRVVNCTSPTSPTAFTGLHSRFIEQELIVNELEGTKDKVDIIINKE